MPRRYNRRGPVCPECQATMEVPASGDPVCRFAGSHEDQRKVRQEAAREREAQKQRENRQVKAAREEKARLARIARANEEHRKKHP